VSVVVGVLGLLLFGAGIVGIGYGWRRRRQRTVIADTETTDALRLTPGPAEVVGTADASDEGPLPAPFSEASCLLAEWEIEEWDESGKHSSWRTEGQGTVTTPFYVDDGTDRVLVRPSEATVDLSVSRETTRVGVDEEPPESIRRFLDLDSTPGDPDEALIKALDWGTQVGDRKYHQRLLKPGDEVYVHGTATRVGAETFGANDFELVESADDGHPDAELFLVADSTESELIADRRDWLLYAGAGALAALVGFGVIAASVLPP
jgi:hypothetical protein